MNEIPVDEGVYEFNGEQYLVLKVPKVEKYIVAADQTNINGGLVGWCKTHLGLAAHRKLRRRKPRQPRQRRERAHGGQRAA